MQDLLKSVEGSMDAGYIYPAFMSAIRLPDICGYLDEPNQKSVGKRYENWFTNYMPHAYQGYISGEEAYALRCIVLHNGELGLKQYTNRSKQSNIILDKIELNKRGIHLLRATGNVVNGVSMPNLVRLSAEQYCKDIIGEVRNWEGRTAKSLGDYGEVFKIGEGGNTFTL